MLLFWREYDSVDQIVLLKALFNELLLLPLLFVKPDSECHPVKFSVDHQRFQLRDLA